MKLYFKKEKLTGLFTRIFIDGYTGRQGLYQKIFDQNVPLVLSLKPFMGSNLDVYGLEDKQLLHLVIQIFKEGQSGFQDTRESIIESLILSLIEFFIPIPATIITSSIVTSPATTSITSIMNQFWVVEAVNYNYSLNSSIQYYNSTNT